MPLILRPMAAADEAPVRALHAQLAAEDFTFLFYDGTWAEILAATERDSRNPEPGRVPADFFLAEVRSEGEPGHGGAEPERGGAEPGHAGTVPERACTEPERAGTEPERAGTEPGHWGTEPGHWGTEPEHQSTEPGHQGAEPGHDQQLANGAGVIVGRASIRWELNEHLRAFGGHIGYGVGPAFRRRGYATEILRQSLALMHGRGIEHALLTCDDDNHGSIRVIERCGGVLEDIRVDPAGLRKRRYWVPTAPVR